MTSRLQTVFVNFNKSHYLYFTHANTFFLEGVLRFHQTLKGVCGTKKGKNTSYKEKRKMHIVFHLETRMVRRSYYNRFKI
jgi:hypothetical protein